MQATHSIKVNSSNNILSNVGLGHQLICKITGKSLKNTLGDGFHSDIQKIDLNENVQLYCFQPPCGGNVYVINAQEEIIMVDSGYGIYYHDFLKLYQHCGIDLTDLKGIYMTHGDADHCGAGGYYGVKLFLHKGTYDIIEEANRAYGSNVEECVLEEVYTKLINLFSRFNSPVDMEIFPDKTVKMRGPFPVIHTFKIGGLEFEVLESLGGHLYGQIFLICPSEGLIFTADSLINFDSLSEDRKRYNLLAKNLMTSVNVDDAMAKKERNALLKLVLKLNEELSIRNKNCLICSGHGAVSVLSGDKLEVYGQINHYESKL